MDGAVLIHNHGHGVVRLPGAGCDPGVDGFHLGFGYGWFHIVGDVPGDSLKWQGFPVG